MTPKCCLLCSNSPRYGTVYCTPCSEKVAKQKVRDDLLTNIEFGIMSIQDNATKTVLNDILSFLRGND